MVHILKPFVFPLVCLSNGRFASFDLDLDPFCPYIPSTEAYLAHFIVYWSARTNKMDDADSLHTKTVAINM
jgi:hypothetical protein